MTTRIFTTKFLKLPIDVKMPAEIKIHGEITGDYSEIVVLKQLYREIFEDAFVCHITKGDWGIGIYDMPGFYFIKVETINIKEFCDLKFTMVSIIDAIKPKEYMPDEAAKANWLY